MRLVIDSGASEAQDDEELLTARAYVASVVGPRRAPQGRSKTISGPVTNALVARNDTQSRVLFVTVSSTVAAATFSKTPGGASLAVGFNGNAGTPSLPNAASFILYPSEELYLNTTGAAAFSVFESRF